MKSEYTMEEEKANRRRHLNSINLTNLNPMDRLSEEERLARDLYDTFGHACSVMNEILFKDSPKKLEFFAKIFRRHYQNQTDYSQFRETDPHLLIDSEGLPALRNMLYELEVSKEKGKEVMQEVTRHLDEMDQIKFVHQY